MAEDPRAHYAQISGALRRSSQESPGQGGSLPVQEHLPAGLQEKICDFCTHKIIYAK